MSPFLGVATTASENSMSCLYTYHQHVTRSDRYMYEGRLLHLVIVVYQMVPYRPQYYQLCDVKGVYNVARGRILGVDYLADTGHFR